MEDEDGRDAGEIKKEKIGIKMEREGEKEGRKGEKKREREGDWHGIRR